MNVTLARINSQWYEINTDAPHGGWVAKAINGGWVVVERHPNSTFGVTVGSGASLDEAIENWQFPAATNG